MKEEEFKKYVEKTDNNIKKILKDEELDFYQRLVRAFNRICDKNEKLEQALDEIEKICNSIPKDHSICDIGKIHNIEVIIQKAKGDDK